MLQLFLNSILDRLGLTNFDKKWGNSKGPVNTGIFPIKPNNKLGRTNQSNIIPYHG